MDEQGTYKDMAEWLSKLVVGTVDAWYWLVEKGAWRSKGLTKTLTVWPPTVMGVVEEPW